MLLQYVVFVGSRVFFDFRHVICIVLYFLPVLNPKSYDEARVLEVFGLVM